MNHRPAKRQTGAKMLRHSPPKLSGSVPDLSTESRERDNVTHRKRKHSNELQDLLDSNTEKIMGKLNELKTDINAKLSILTESTQDLKAEMNNIRKEYAGIKTSLNNLSTSHADLQKEVTSLQQSVQFNSDQQTDTTKKLNSLTKEMKAVSTLNNEISELKKDIRVLKLQINTNEQRDRLTNLEIIGIPEDKGENLVKIMEELGKFIGISISSDDIKEIHRVSPKVKMDGRPRIIVAKMNSRLTRDNVISRVRRCRVTTKDLNLRGEPKPIYVNEHLTVSNKILLKKTKDIAKNKEYLFTWTKNGRIYVRKNDTTHAIQITEEEDLKKII